MESAAQRTFAPAEIRFSLRSALLALSAICVLVAPTQWFGGDYLVCAIFSATLILVCAVLYRKSAGAAIGAAFVGALIGLVLVLGVVVFFFHAVVNAIACMVLAPFKPRLRTFAGTLIAIMIAVYGYSFYLGFEKSEELRLLRAKYPFVSLTDRLSFEKPSEQNASQALSTDDPSSTVVAHLLSQDAEQTSRGWRTDALRELHTDYQRDFVRAAGFGFSRMPSLEHRVVRFDREKPLSLPKPIDLAQSPSSGDDLFNVHRLAAADFTTPDGIGYVKSRDAVAGFEPHQIKTSWQWDHNKPGAQYWQIVRLELVGLLRSEAPRVYTAKTLPPMDQIADTPHRALNNFESVSLPKLNSQEDIVVDQTPNRIQMLGALRAGNTCLECHQGQRGKLLGAFSYELTPIERSIHDEDSAPKAEDSSDDSNAISRIPASTAVDTLSHSLP